MTENPQHSSKILSTPITRLTTGDVGLDEILHGGLPTNHLYLIEGDPGTGKTTLALRFLLEGASKGEPVLYVTLSETKKELEDVAASHGWSLDAVTIYELVPAEESLTSETQYTIFHPSEVELGDTTKQIIDEVERIRPRRVVFDSLSEMRLLARDPLRYRRQILGLKQFFSGRQSTVLLLDDRTSGALDLQIESIAHGVIELEQLALDYGAERRRMRVSKLRGSRFLGGFHDFTIQTGGVRVYPRLVAAHHHAEFTDGDVSSGIEGLDSLVGGGLPRGTSTLIMGPTGSGKSVIAAQFAFAAAERGEHAATFIFDEGVQAFRLRAAGIGQDTQRHIDSGRMSLQQIDPAELAPGEFAARVREVVESMQAKLVIIDSLNGYLQAMPEERFLTLQMHELLTYLNQQGVVTILLMAQSGFLGTNMTSPVDVSYLADSVVLLRYFEAGGKVRRALSVVKKRTGAHENTIRELWISSKGIKVGNPLEEFHGVLSGIPSYSGDITGLSGGTDDES